MSAKVVVVNQPVVEAGFEGGRDFSDGVIAHEGSWLGAEEFLSFDSKAASVLRSQSVQARLLSYIAIRKRILF